MKKNKQDAPIRPPNTLVFNRMKVSDPWHGKLVDGLTEVNVPETPISKSLVRFRWEFMRRDPAVKKLYPKTLDLARVKPSRLKMKEKERWFDRSGKVRDNLQVWWLPLPDITKSFDKLIEGGEETVERLCLQLGGFYPISIDYDRSSLPEKVSIRTVIHHADAVKRIFSDLMNELILKKRADTELEIKVRIQKIQERKIFRQRKDFEAILKVGTLKEDHPGWTDLRIAKEINHPGKAGDETRQRIYNWRKEYERLITGGWRDIR